MPLKERSSVRRHHLAENQLTADRCGVRQHAQRSLHLSQIAVGNHGGRLVVDSHLEACRTPIDELNRSLGLDRCYRSADVLRDHITTVQHAA